MHMTMSHAPKIVLPDRHAAKRLIPRTDKSFLFLFSKKKALLFEKKRIAMGGWSRTR
jgi:hypothetical protein